jgi:hypothetical protein
VAASIDHEVLCSWSEDRHVSLQVVFGVPVAAVAGCNKSSSKRSTSSRDNSQDSSKHIKQQTQPHQGWRSTD